MPTQEKTAIKMVCEICKTSTYVNDVARGKYPYFKFTLPAGWIQAFIGESGDEFKAEITPEVICPECSGPIMHAARNVLEDRAAKEA